MASEHGENYRISLPVLEVRDSGGEETQDVENGGEDENGKGETIDHCDDDDGEVSEKRKLTSKMWQHFRKYYDDKSKEWKAECNYCKKLLSADSKNGTSNLKKHFESSCRKRSKTMDIKQAVLRMGKCGNVENFVFDKDQSREELAKMVLLHDYPISIVDHIGFRNFCSRLNLSFKPVTRNTLRRDTLSMYAKYKSKYYMYLEKLKCRIAITTDMWTSQNNNKGFMAITAHYIDDDWLLKSFILRFAYLPTPHTADALSDALVETFVEWNIDRKLSTITMDNCSTNDKVISLLLDKLPRKELLLNGKVLHVRCNAHILNLIVQVGLSEIEDIIEKIRAGIAYWTASPKRIEKFEYAAHQCNIPYDKKLSLDCKTRWNSTYLMLKSAFIYKDVFPRLPLVDRLYKNPPTEKDWRDAMKVADKLQIFYRATLIFSGTLYPTSNLFFHIICDMKIKLDQWEKSLDETISKMASKMIQKFSKYWDTCHLLLGVAAVLDPRNKMKVVEFYFPLIYGKDADLKILEFKKSCQDLLDEFKSCDASTTASSSLGASRKIGASSCSTSFEFDDQDMSMYDQYMSQGMDFSSASDVSELELYLREPLFPKVDNFNVLSWWQLYGNSYPTMKKIAKDILAVPVSTVASESAFSTSGNIITPIRSRLEDDILEALMCGRHWAWNEINGTYSTKESCASVRNSEVEDEEVEAYVPGLSD